MPDRSMHEQELDRFFNDLAIGRPGVDYQLDPSLMETVRTLRAMAATPLPAPAREHVAPALQAEMARLAEHHAGGTRPSPGEISPNFSHFGQNGRVLNEPGMATTAAHSLRRPRWLSPGLAAAAILVLALVGGVVAARFIAAERTAMVIEAPEPPAVETLVDASVESPADGWTSLSVERWTFQPGSARLTIAPLEGPQWVVAETSGLVATVDGAQRDLAPGDGMLVAAGRELVLLNANDTTAAALRGLATTGFSHEEYDRDSISRQIALDTEAHEALPRGSSRIVFERMTLHAGTTLLIEPATGQDWVGVAAGRLGLTLVGDSLPGSWQSGREREFAVGDKLPGLVPGTHVTLRNVGDDPLVLLRLRVMPLTGPTS
jgi:hypothetical protein